MTALQTLLDEAVTRLRAAGTDLQSIEVKSAFGGLPKSATESVSAFANGLGGTLILGLDERSGFVPVEINAAKLAADLASACSDDLEPPIRPQIDIGSVDGMPVVVAQIDELDPSRKPCFVRTRGMDRGSYIRTHDGDRHLTTYEVHVLRASRGQPLDDTTPVPGATIADLDARIIESLTHRLRTTRGSVFAAASEEEILRLMGVLIGSGADTGVSLAGLMALGRYPQQFFPQLDVTFVSFATTSGQPLDDGTRFMDNQSIDGPIPAMVAEALTAMRRNMQRRSIIVGLGREDRWEYPEEAVREVVANALMHRDYNPQAHGAQTRIMLYPDRLEVISPGGLHGPIAREDLLAEPVTSSRNSRLAKLLEDVEVGSTGRTVCENRGSGLLATAEALRRAGLEPPEIHDSIREFKVVIRSHGLMNNESVAWLATIDTAGLNDNQRLGLAFLHRSARITNQQYRTLTGCDALTATRDLTGLAAAGLVEKVNDRRWTVWRLADGAKPLQPALEFPDSGSGRPGQDRVGTICRLLTQGPLSSQALADALDMSKQGTLNWLHKMEDMALVEPTSEKRRSRYNKWRLVEGSDRTR